MARSSDIRQKEVINMHNGKRMGTIIDMDFSPDGRINSITVPGEMRLMDVFRGQKNNVVIPWSNIAKIGEDVILVNVTPTNLRSSC